MITVGPTRIAASRAAHDAAALAEARESKIDEQ